MANDKITMIEKENPPRVKEEYSTLSITVTCDDPNVIIAPAAQKPATLKFPMPLVEKIEGPFDENDNLVEELEVGKTYIFKATNFKESTFTPIKHIWWAEQLDDGEITNLEYKKGENPFLNDKGVVCFKYTPKECEKVRIYAYVAKPVKSVSIETKVMSKKIIAFFIGGASDKEGFYGTSPTKIVEDEVKKVFKDLLDDKNLSDLYEDSYLGYNEVRGEKDIENNVISKIPNKDRTAIYIIGHSLGGWNGAHLSQILTDKGYNVDLLITLDPVGTGADVKLVSDIYWTEPKPKANYWIHISTFPEDYRADDFIADYGGQWRPKSGMQISDECSCNHGSAGFMFTKNLKDTNISASDMLFHQIQLFLSKETVK